MFFLLTNWSVTIYGDRLRNFAGKHLSSNGGIIDVGGGRARGARAPPTVGLEILSGLKPQEKKRRKEEKEKK